MLKEQIPNLRQFFSRKLGYTICFTKFFYNENPWKKHTNGLSKDMIAKSN